MHGHAYKSPIQTYQETASPNDHVISYDRKHPVCRVKNTAEGKSYPAEGNSFLGGIEFLRRGGKEVVLNATPGLLINVVLVTFYWLVLAAW